MPVEAGRRDCIKLWSFDHGKELAMRFQRRVYQARAIANLERLFRRHRRVLAVSPTSSGKTVIAAHFLKKHPKARVLWVAHRVELLRQARAELIDAGVPEVDVGILTTAERENVTARILVTSVGMWRQRDLPPGIRWIVVDEAHRAAAKSYRSLLSALPKARVLGLTATPVRADRSPLGDIFQELLIVATPSELLARKILAKPRCFGIERDKARLIASVAGSGGRDWSAKSSARGMRTMYGDIVADVRRLATGLQTLVFVATRDYGKRLCRRFLSNGLSAEYLDGYTSALERTAIVARLRSGATKIVINVDVLSEGFDCPPVKCVVLARPTRSLTRLLQQCGRAGRAHKRQRPIIIDSAGNFTRFPLPHFDHDWSLSVDGLPAIAPGGESPTKACADCLELIPTGCLLCPECGAEQPKSDLVEERDLELIELRETDAENNRRLSVLRDLARANGKGESWVKQALAAIG